MKAGSHETTKRATSASCWSPLPKSPMTAKDTSATVGVGVLALGALVVGSVLAVGAGVSRRVPIP